MKLSQLKKIIKNDHSLNTELLHSFISYQFLNANDDVDIPFKLFNDYLKKNGFVILVPNEMIENEGDGLFAQLIKQRIDLRIQDKYAHLHLLGYDIPLKGAIITQNLSLVEELIRGGADVNIRGAYHIIEHSPLWHSIRTGNMAIFDVLLDAKADINFRHPYYIPDSTALTCALEYNRNQQLVKLLQHGARVITLTNKDNPNYSILERFQWIQSQEEKPLIKLKPSHRYKKIMQKKTPLPDVIIDMIAEYGNLNENYFQQAAKVNPKELRFPHRFFDKITKKLPDPTMLYGEEIFEAFKKIERLSYDDFKLFINDFTKNARLEVYVQKHTDEDSLLIKMQTEPMLGKLKAIEEYLKQSHSYQSSFYQFLINTIRTFDVSVVSERLKPA